jgi:hypothetical protein
MKKIDFKQEVEVFGINIVRTLINSLVTFVAMTFFVLGWIFLLQLLENQRTLELKIAIFCKILVPLHNQKIFARLD